jgi:aminoglycoside 2''-phosphotransferase
MYAAIQDSLFPQMRPGAQDWVTGQFEQFLSDPGSFDYVPTLRHGDFGPSNILYDQNTLTITGVIDFASAGLGDRAIDFAGLRSGFGEDFLRRVARHYPIDRPMMKRIIFYQSTFALQEALYGFDNNDEEAFNNGMEDFV